jgi:Trk-type K+ transport system membrane component
MVALLMLLGRLMGGLNEPGFGHSLLMTGLATAGMSLSLLLIMPFLAGTPWLAALVGMIVGGGVYVVLAQLLDIQEWQVIRRQLMKRRHLFG